MGESDHVARNKIFTQRSCTPSTNVRVFNRLPPYNDLHTFDKTGANTDNFHIVGNSKFSILQNFATYASIIKVVIAEKYPVSIKSTLFIHRLRFNKRNLINITNIYNTVLKTILKMSLSTLNKNDGLRPKLTLSNLNFGKKQTPKPVMNALNDWSEVVKVKNATRTKSNSTTVNTVPRTMPTDEASKTPKRNNRSPMPPFIHRCTTTVKIAPKIEGIKDNVNTHFLLAALLRGFQMVDPTAYLGTTYYTPNSHDAIVSAADIPKDVSKLSNYVEDDHYTNNKTFVCRIFLHSNTPLNRIKSHPVLSSWLRIEKILLERNILQTTKPVNIGFLINIIPTHDNVEIYEERLRRAVGDCTPVFQSIPKSIFVESTRCAILMIMGHPDDIDDLIFAFQPLLTSDDFCYSPWNQFMTLTDAKKRTIIHKQLSFCTTYRSLFIPGFHDNIESTPMWYEATDTHANNQESINITNNPVTDGGNITITDAEMEKSKTAFDKHVDEHLMDPNTQFDEGEDLDTHMYDDSIPVHDEVDLLPPELAVPNKDEVPVARMDGKFNLTTITIGEYMTNKFRAGDGNIIFDYVYPSVKGTREVLVTIPHYLEALSLQKVILAELSRVMNDEAINTIFVSPDEVKHHASISSPWTTFELQHQITDYGSLTKKERQKELLKLRRKRQRSNRRLRENGNYNSNNNNHPLSRSTDTSSSTHNNTMKSTNTTIDTTIHSQGTTTYAPQVIHNIPNRHTTTPLSSVSLLSTPRHESDYSSAIIAMQKQIADLLIETNKKSTKNLIIDETSINQATQIELGKLQETISKNVESMDLKILSLQQKLDENTIATTAEFKKNEDKAQLIFQSIQKTQIDSENTLLSKLSELNTDNLTIHALLKYQIDKATERDALDREDRARNRVRDDHIDMFLTRTMTSPNTIFSPPSVFNSSIQNIDAITNTKLLTKEDNLTDHDTQPCNMQAEEALCSADPKCKDNILEYDEETEAEIVNEIFLHTQASIQSTPQSKTNVNVSSIYDINDNNKLHSENEDDPNTVYNSPPRKLIGIQTDSCQEGNSIRKINQHPKTTQESTVAFLYKDCVHPTSTAQVCNNDIGMKLRSRSVVRQTLATGQQ